MSKRVRIPAFPELRINEAQLLAMLNIHEFSGSQGHVVRLGVCELAERMDRASGTVTKILHALADQGLIEIRESYWPNGGQRENCYCLTRLGVKVLGRVDRF